MRNLSEYIEQKFGIDEKKFLEVIRISPGAEGYLLGSLGEQLFKEHAENLGYEVLRIKEKPEGGYNAKSDDARGDFYIRKKGTDKDEWLVVECKGVKSNSEKRANLTSRASCYNLLKKYSLERDKQIANILKSGKAAYAKSKKSWENRNKDVDYGNFQWQEENPGAGIPDLRGLWKDNVELKEWLENFNEEDFSENSYWDLKSPIRLIQTHMPSTRVDHLGIKSTGPLVSEFNILCLDLFLRTGKHEFVFANSKELNHQAKSPNHLQQNYTIDILVAKDGFARHKMLKPWYDNLDKCIKISKPIPRNLDLTQLDKR